jgi:CBS domain-containing protein
MPLIRPDDPVRVLMSSPATSIDSRASLFDVAVKLNVAGIGAVAVMAGDHLEGVVSERDVVRAIATGHDIDQMCAADVMAADPLVVDADDPLIVAADLMLEWDVRHLPVLCNGRVVGILSTRDVLRVVAGAWRRSAESTAT